jgi:hypothetical protein
MALFRGSCERASRLLVLPILVLCLVEAEGSSLHQERPASCLNGHRCLEEVTVERAEVFDIAEAEKALEQGRYLVSGHMKSAGDTSKRVFCRTCKYVFADHTREWIRRSSKPKGFQPPLSTFVRNFPLGDLMVDSAKVWIQSLSSAGERSEFFSVTMKGELDDGLSQILNYLDENRDIPKPVQPVKSSSQVEIRWSSRGYIGEIRLWTTDVGNTQVRVHLLFI